MTDIRVFWHVNELGGWREVADQQWRLLLSSGLYDAAKEVHVCCNGQPWTFTDWFNTKLPDLQENKVKLISVCNHAAFHEWPTLNYMHDQCKQSTSNFLVCYIHLKGLLRYGDPNVADWREFMNWGAIERWQDNVTALADHDCAGTNWNTEPWPHFSGNFWWARSDYIKKLDPLMHPEDKLNRQITQFKPHPTEPHWRFDNEAWIGSKDPNYKEIARSLDPGERHYRERYPRSLYQAV
jgi:hypothetical protein